MLVSVRLRRLAREYNMRVLSDKPKHDNFCQSGQKKGSKHTPIASGTPYSTSQPIHPLSYATSRNPPPESNKRPTNCHDYMTYSSKTSWFHANWRAVPCHRWINSSTANVKLSLCRMSTVNDIGIRPCQRHDTYLADPGTFCCFEKLFLRGRFTCVNEDQDKEAHSW